MHRVARVCQLQLSYLLGWLFDRVDLIKLVSIVEFVCPCVRPFVRPQIFFDFNDIWNVGRGRSVMHNGMQYDPIQGQGQGH